MPIFSEKTNTLLKNSSYKLIYTESLRNGFSMSNYWWNNISIVKTLSILLNYVFFPWKNNSAVLQKSEFCNFAEESIFLILEILFLVVRTLRRHSQIFIYIYIYIYIYIWELYLYIYIYIYNFPFKLTLSILKPCL